MPLHCLLLSPSTIADYILMSHRLEEILYRKRQGKTSLKPCEAVRIKGNQSHSAMENKTRAPGGERSPDLTALVVL